MLARLVRTILGRLGRTSPPATPLLALPPPDAVPDEPQDIDNGVGHLQTPLLPEYPVHNGEPVPRWPEHGAALLVATPAALLATQEDLIRRIRDTSPLAVQDFDRLVLPAFERYARWVHLLPASEYHHHFGAGGLLRHGFEVALHAARMAEGKHVGVDLPPSARARYEVRWRVAAMFGGLLHDLGKPLVDCGATDPERTMTWPAHAGDLYSWLQANKLTHYRIYWRSGVRHERHKPVGTAVTREILGPDLLAWLSNEPTQEVMNLLMMAIAGTPAMSNVMSLVVSKADSMSVEADLKRLAKRTQATASGGTQSAAGLVMAQLRRMVESNRIIVNKPGGQLWVVGDGCFGAYPALIEAVVSQMKRDEIPAFPASRGEIAELLAETGFIEPCVADTADGRQRSLTWDVRITFKRGQEMAESAPLKALRFTDPQLVFGAALPPPPATGTVRSPFLSTEDAQAIADAVAVDDRPQTAASAVGGSDVAAGNAAGAPGASPEPAAAQVDTAAAPAPAESEPAESVPEHGGSGTAGSAEATPHVEDRRNRRDVASDRRYAAEQEQKKPQQDLKELIKKVSRTSLCGPACAEILRSIYRATLVHGTDYVDTSDGLAVAYPAALEGLGMPPEDILAGASENRWVAAEAGSDRKVTERTFPDGHRRKCVIFTGDMGAAWTALMLEHPEVLEARPAPAAAQGNMANRAAPQESQRSGSKAPPAGSSQPRSVPQRPVPQPQPTPQRAAGHRPQSTEPAQAAQRPASPEPRSRSAQPAATSNPQPHPNPSRQRKLDRPAVGAQPAVGAGARPAPPPAASPAAKPASREDQPPKSIKCDLVKDLTPVLVADINAVFVLGAEAMLMANPENFDITKVEDLKKIMRAMVESKGVRPAPLLTALTSTDNPALIMKMPASQTVREITSARLNPDYQRPRWLVQTLATKRQELEARA